MWRGLVALDHFLQPISQILIVRKCIGVAVLGVAVCSWEAVDIEVIGKNKISST